MNNHLNGRIEKLTDGILESYKADERMKRIGLTFLPSRTKIVEILEQTRQLIFPGFFGHKRLSQQNIGYHVGNLVAHLGWELAEQINHCLCTERDCNKCDDLNANACMKEAHHTACEFLHNIPKIRQMLALDAQAAYDGDPAAKSVAEIIYSYPGYYAVATYRMAHELLSLGVALMPRIMSEHAHSVTGCDIHPGANIGKSLFIDHATGVVIGETCKIGNNVKIYQGVTLGALSFPKDERGRVIKGLKRHPTIEDDVTIYANATILGGDTVIGKGSTIGGNTFVTKSIPPESIVLQSEAELQVKSKKHK